MNLSEKNKMILEQREALFNKRLGMRVGDFLKIENDLYVRFSHDWGNDIQTALGGSFHFGNGSLSFSGL
jgi:hypothetical protein